MARRVPQPNRPRLELEMKIRYRYAENEEVFFELILDKNELRQALLDGVVPFEGSAAVYSELKRADADAGIRDSAIAGSKGRDDLASDKLALQPSVHKPLIYRGIEATIPEGFESSNREAVENAVLDALVEANDVVLDSIKVENEFAHSYEALMHGMRYQWYRTGNREALDELLSEDGKLRVRADVEHNMKLEAILKEIVLSEQLKIEPGDLESLAFEIADREDTPIDVVKRLYGEDYSLLADDALTQKAIGFVIDHATVR